MSCSFSTARTMQGINWETAVELTGGRQGWRVHLNISLYYLTQDWLNCLQSALSIIQLDHVVSHLWRDLNACRHIFLHTET